MNSGLRTIGPAYLRQEGSMKQNLSQTIGTHAGSLLSSRFIPLTLRSLKDRVILLTDIGLPCLVTLGAPAGFGGFTLLTGWRDIDGDGLCLLGNGFSVVLRRQEIGSIQVVYQDSPAQPSAVRVNDHKGGLIASLVGLPSSSEGAVWEDVIGNPCYVSEERP
jgi:hypothetical protein